MTKEELLQELDNVRRLVDAIEPVDGGSYDLQREASERLVDLYDIVKEGS